MRTNPHRIRRLTTGTTLCLAAVLMVTALFVDPGTWGDDREVVSYQDNPALAQLQSALYHWGYLLMAVAVLGLAHFTRRRAVLAGHVVAGVAAIGWINLSALLLTDPVNWWFGERYAPEEAERLTNEVLEIPGVIFGFMVPGPFLALGGTVALFVILWRAGFVRVWVPLLFAAWVAGSFTVPYGPAAIPLWLAGTGVLAHLGLRILRMTDEAYAGHDAALPAAPAAPDTSVLARQA
ncbi:hypothetical protein ACOCJ5_00725 [Knoellia sp. CPCC 206450]|uniref:hypothetical protein n=1 Tax=Knoellia tibetensis TaxID=3404798 RepID=UPI003B42E78A